ncbi:hypothetical protein CBOM_00589 [Ceraceosorus bombacis]|uniref:Uncharacterized protein n=1 Tax=Ceraceosorus bombacis TaxID=401625 RepID=A0A0P1BBF9_9BASI|nr:hypothetical protein CBOM_00589 [Ceraceosorus bombacis]
MRKKKTETSILAVMQDEARKLLVEKKHPAMAICILLVPEADRLKLDALTGDTSCQSRTMVLLDTAQALNTYLLRNGKLEEFQRLARDFLERPVGEKALKEIRTTEDVFCGKPISDNLAQYLDHFSNVVGDEVLKACGLCYSNTENSLFFNDENGGYFSDISDLAYKAEMPGTKDGLPVRKDHTYDLRAALGEACTKAIFKKAVDASADGFQPPNAHDAPTIQLTFEKQLAAAVAQVVSSCPQKDGAGIPVQAIVPQTLVVLGNAYRNGHMLNLRIRRVRMSPVESRRDDEAEEEIAESGDSPRPPPYNYMLTAARTFQAIPNQATGRFEVASEVSPEHEHTLGMSFDFFSYYLQNENGEGLLSSCDDVYYAAITSDEMDPVWSLILPSLVAHSPFSGYAKDKSADHDAFYKKLCPPSRSLIRSRYQLEGFAFGSAKGNDDRPSLYELISHCRKMMTEYDLHDIREFLRDEANRGGFERRRKPHPCAIRHIWIGSYKEVKAEGNKLLHERHKHPDIVCQGPLFRLGKGAASFRSSQEVKDFIKERRCCSMRAKTRYAEAYPENWAYLQDSGKV